MYHSVTIGDKNTWDDWHLIPSTRPTINPPKRVDNVITVPGSNTPLDMSGFLAGHPVYSNRTGNLVFEVVNDYRDWTIAFKDIGNYLQDRYDRMILEDDPNYYYYGKFLLESWTPNKNWSEISIAYDLYPFRKPVNLPSNFTNINLLTGDKVISFEGTVEYGNPEVIVRGADDTGIRLYHSTGNEVDNSPIYTSKSVFHAYNGTQEIKGLKLGPGQHTITFSGKGVVTFNYRGGIV